MQINVGIENRDYARDGSYTRIGSSEAMLSNAPACKWLILITVAVYLLQIFSNGVIEDWLLLDTEKIVFQGQIWRLFTLSLIHI